MMVSFKGHNVFSLFNDEKKLKHILKFILEKLDRQEIEIETSEVIKNSPITRRLY